jgi:hypothetical protein
MEKNEKICQSGPLLPGKPIWAENEVDYFLTMANHKRSRNTAINSFSAVYSGKQEKLVLFKDSDKGRRADGSKGLCNLPMTGVFRVEAMESFGRPIRYAFLTILVNQGGGPCWYDWDRF